MASFISVSNKNVFSLAKACLVATSTIKKILGVSKFVYGTLDPSANGGGTLSNGNLTWYSGDYDRGCNGNAPLGGGRKYYFEFCFVGIAATRSCMAGLGVYGSPVSQSGIQSVGSQWLLGADGGKYSTGNPDSYPFSNFTAGQWGALAYDSAAGKVWLRSASYGWSGDPAAGTGEAWSGVSGDVRARVVTADYGPTLTFNFGASAFQYAVPSGFTSRVGV
jgi:hypothetical protein